VQITPRTLTTMSYSPAQYALADDLIVLAIINHCDSYKDYRQLVFTSRVFYRVSVQQQHKYTQKDQDNKATMDAAIRLWRQYHVEKMVGIDEVDALREAERQESEKSANEIFIHVLRYVRSSPNVTRESTRMILNSGMFWNQPDNVINNFYGSFGS
jgi:hypothetical protein